MPPFDVKASLWHDVQSIDLALVILNSLRETQCARLALLAEEERRSEEA